MADYNTPFPTEDEYFEFACLIYDYGPKDLSAAALEYRIENLKIAKAFWETVPEYNVLEGLTTWGETGGESCGTLACFGGHLARAGMFGITHGVDRYYPRLGSGVDSGGVAEWLFGENLFEVVKHSEVENFIGVFSSHAVVTNRINKQLALLQDVLESRAQND